MVSLVVNRASLYMPPARFSPVCDTNCGQIQARRISFCDALDKEKGFENSIVFATVAAGLYNRQFLKTIR